MNIDTIDLKDINFTLGKTQASFAGDSTHGVLTVTDGINSVNLSLVGNYLSSTFGTISDGNGGTIVYDPPGQPQISSTTALSKDNFTFRPDLGTAASCSK